MNFSWALDGSIIGFYILISLLVGLSIRKYVTNVEDYLVAGREVNLYAGMASLAATEFGIVTCMAAAQLGYRYGFSGAIVGLLLCTSMYLVGKTGFCIKPLRDANAMTLPEFFEKKYSPRVRWATGVIIVIGGLLNTGVFLRTGGDFLVAVVGLNPKYLEITMTGLLIVVALYTVLGGMISVLVTDFLQFILMSAGMIIVTIYIVFTIGWGNILDAVQSTYGAAGFNPFINKNLGWQYVMYTFLTVSATVLTWQTMISRVLACKDSTVAKKMYTKTSFFYIVRSLIPVSLGLAALTIWKPDMLGGAPITAMPKFLAAALPTGLIGIVVAAMLAADMSTDSSYLLGWASVIYNDILVVLHKGTWSEKKAVFLNKILVAAIGLFLLFYGLWYPLKSDLWVYMTLTASIYSVSVSTLLIAACYWKKANTWGAYAAIVVGSATPLLFLIMQQIPATTELAKSIGPYYSGIAAFAFAWIAMIIGSNLKIMLKK
jgi:SSS family solute:Na+ symporter